MFGFLQHFRQHIKQGWRSPLKWWVVAFLLVHALMDHPGGTNASSRLAALAAFAERGSYRLDPGYQTWTTDWARTPDGRYTSNKAPGATLLATPFYWGLDALSQWDTQSVEQERHRRFVTARPFLRILSLLLQAIPWALLALVFLNLFQQAGHSLWTQQLFLGAFLFGNTAAIFMNTFFGHGLAAVWLGFLTLALYWKSFVWAGFFYGWALLTDYGSAWVLPPVMAWLVVRRFSIKAWAQLVLGGLLPGLCWISYHVHYYGGAFSLPNKFQNPRYLDLADEQGALWGVIRLFPNWQSLGELLWGAQRGLFWFQPWLFLLFIATPFLWLKRESLKNWGSEVLAGMTLLFFSLLGLLYMNASFGAWNGGHSAGPRYISIVLPFYALLLPIVYKHAGRTLQKVLSATTLYATILGVLILCTTVAFFPRPLWTNLAEYLLPGRYFATTCLRVGVCILIGLWAWRKVQAGLKQSRS